MIQETLKNMFSHFPTRWQAVIFRNYGKIKSEIIAKVLGTTKDIIEDNAALMGLERIEFIDDWRKRGYITIIKENWHILSRKQLLVLLDISEELLADILKNEDFLGIKLGDINLYAQDARYSKLNERELEETEKIKSIISQYDVEYKEKPFEFRKHFNNRIFDNTGNFRLSGKLDEKFMQFWTTYYDLSALGGVSVDVKKSDILHGEDYSISLIDNNIGISAGADIGVFRALQEIAENAIANGKVTLDSGVRKCLIENRIISPYLCGSGDILQLDIDSVFSEDYLIALVKNKINCVFIGAVLQKLVSDEFYGEKNDDYIKRIEIIKSIIARLDKFGIKLFLYFNEPRAIAKAGFENTDLLGIEENELATLCTSNAKVIEYLKNSFTSFLKCVVGLGGIITITASENLTNCYTRGSTTCARCASREKAVVFAEINNVIMQAIQAADTGAQLIAWNWGWDTDASGKTSLQVINNLADDIIVMGNAEQHLEIDIAGQKNHVIDYTISQTRKAPSKIAKEIAAYTKERNKKFYAKIQLNNSWECSATPYIPAFDLNYDYFKNLNKMGINGVMLSWSLGGYSSPNMSLVSNFYFDKQFSYDEWLKSNYGEDAESVKERAKQFSNILERYPFSVAFVYFSPVNVGCANLFYRQKTGLEATMIGYPYDDIEKWVAPYDKNIVIEILGKMCDEIKDIIERFAIPKRKNTQEFLREISVFYSNIFSAYLQMKFITETNYERQKQLIELEITNTEKLLGMYLSDCTLGYEASNHYLFSVNAILEKIINLKTNL